MADGFQRPLVDLVREVEERSPGLIVNASDVLAASASGSHAKNSEVVVTRVTQDSRNVSSGSIFCAIRGSSVDGHDYVNGAVASGAVAVLVEPAHAGSVDAGSAKDAIELHSNDTAKATGLLAGALFGFPADDLSLVAVTGTNGKTSIVTILSHIVNHCGGVAASMGTLTGSLTTAAAPDFHAALAGHRSDGASVVAAEVSSHALDQQRIAGATVAVAIFSNLTQDHLDYHDDMDDYFEAKARLFAPEVGAASVIDVSGPYGKRLAERVADTAVEPARLVSVPGDAIAAAGVLSHGSSTFTWRDHEVVLPLGGSFSVNNALLAAEAAVLLGFAEGDVADALAVAEKVPGRFESVDSGQPFGVVVDYSHTPASISVAVASARALATGRVIIVFGAGGDRDAGKRPLMGKAASSADRLYVTSDNPRTEDPAKIIDEVIAGIPDRSDVYRVIDRAEAISAAISDAHANDIVVIAGKGHENYQIMGTTRTDFDDRVHARAALAGLGFESITADPEVGGR